MFFLTKGISLQAFGCRRSNRRSVRSGAKSLDKLGDAFGERWTKDAPMARYTAARVGGPADGLVGANSMDELAKAAIRLWELDIPFVVLGGGSNVLVSDRGVRGVVILNQSRRIVFHPRANPPTVWAESGANFGLLARQASARGLSGLEWAAGIPGTVGGAVVGNAGAHGGSMAECLIVAEILHRQEEKSLAIGKAGTWRVKRSKWPVEMLEYDYRISILKRELFEHGLSPDFLSARQPNSLVLAALMELEKGEKGTIRATMDEFVAYRRRTQPPGASMGSMFKNPPGDYAGRLIEAAGLKGVRIGAAEISPLHANFFINHGTAKASDIWKLIQLARRTVADTFGVLLDLEIALVGDWEGVNDE